MSEDLQPVSSAPIVNPECRDGKHGNCHLDAWDNVKDEPAECECTCHSGRAS